ncbi:hypothetical protein CYLTODRAFT_426578 [Cylindrobasidium torrendii FP15055 ss-10]|uniref:Uncharacterized protein n=1 Tax=Cylindrobasidium torrendii FP15055 ss-10 TaxID=1314674 RepID=A0A0D7B037_9AGAR|nr:hypothetical protein CYLTODRAFT_426578 [Cylindrobasidium torrendii FP15055 ss-10]
MGTTGCIVWRYKNHYFIYFQNSDGYHEQFGVDAWREVPSPGNPQAWDEWLMRKRNELEVFLQKDYKLKADDAYDEIWSTAPLPDVEYTYEIDLDNLVFHENYVPCFNLRHMPSTEAKFLEYLRGSDSYGNATCSVNAPVECRWTMALLESPRLCSIDTTTLETYDSLGAKVVADIVEPPASIATPVRKRLAEVIIAQLMRFNMPRALLQLRQAAQSSSVHSFTKDTRTAVGLCLLATVLHPALYAPRSWRTPINFFYRHIKRKGSRNNSFRYLPDETATWWIRDDIAAHVAANLTNEDHLRAAVVKCLQFMQSATPRSIVYGVLFSISHCALLSWDPVSGKTQHTLPLVFMPDVYAQQRETVGITALVYLAEHIDALADGFTCIRAPQSKSSGPLPIEIMSHIASFITVPKDLFAFASASQVYKRAAKLRLLLPQLGGDIVVALAPEGDGEQVLGSQMVICADGIKRRMLEDWISPLVPEIDYMTSELHSLLWLKEL